MTIAFAILGGALLGISAMLLYNRWKQERRFHVETKAFEEYFKYLDRNRFDL